MTVGLVIVSHSARLAEGVAELAGQMAQGKTPIAAAGGAVDEVLGTSVEKILAAIQAVESPEGVLVLLDLGSAILSTEMALEMLSDDQRQRIRLSAAPLVEGAAAAALEASLGRPLAQVYDAAEQTAQVEQLRLLKPLNQEEQQVQEPLGLTGTLSPEETRPVEAKFTLANPTGLHARPASLFVQTAARFQAHIRAVGHGQESDATSIFGLLSLGLRQGDTLILCASGVDAQAALDALSELIHANFYETEFEVNSSAPAAPVEARVSEHIRKSPGEPWRGIPISAGLALGPALLYTSRAVTLDTVQQRSISEDQVDSERKRLREALHSAAQELHALARSLKSSVGQADAAIFDAQALMLEDPALRDDALELIEAEQIDAASALAKTGEIFAATLETLEDPLIAARAVDMRDAISRVLERLGISGQAVPKQVLSDLRQPVVLMAEDLTPSDTAQLRPEFILGIGTVQGGPTTHAAILARALEIPAIAGIEPQLLDRLHDGQQVAIDGTQGVLYLELDAGQQQELSEVMHQQQRARDLRRTRVDAQWRNQAGSTADGARVQVFANVGDQESARAAAESGAEGIGLLRTEFLFGGRAVFPDEQEQFDSYVALFRAFANAASQGKTIIARTLDAGADKPFPALKPLIGAMQESNPALGLRGARIHLVHEELLRQQLRALLRAGAAAEVQLHIMFPMVATLEEVHRLRAIYHAVREELSGEGVMLPAEMQLGIMVETPAAALMADALAREVDFFSIGANDLYQYTMAADRTNSRVTSMFSMLEPAVWRSIAHVVQAAQAHNKMVAVCGELAADAKIGPLLAGLGVQELSMNPPSIVHVKAALHAHPMEYWQQLAQELLKAETAEDIQLVLQSLE